MRVRFLLDENLSPDLRTAVQGFDPQIDIVRVGDPDAPALGTLDPAILRYLQGVERMLITNNRVSIPQHVADHSHEGGFHWGIMWIRPERSIRELAEALYLLWAASEPAEWRDQTGWIPF